MLFDTNDDTIGSWLACPASDCSLEAETRSGLIWHYIDTHSRLPIQSGPLVRVRVRAATIPMEPEPTATQ